VPRVQHLLSRRVLKRPAVRRRVVRSGTFRRVVTYGLFAMLVGTLATGCAGFDKAFGQREAIVTFQQGTPKSVRLEVRAACSHVPRAVPEPLPTDHKLSDYDNDVRYRIDKASDAELAQLENCLSKFPAVRGVETPQDENS
jgi:hypothetical protein